jgi:hypothetical protein
MDKNCFVETPFLWRKKEEEARHEETGSSSSSSSSGEKRKRNETEGTQLPPRTKKGRPSQVPYTVPL